MERVEAALVLDARALLGEGPAWDGRAGVLWWVDILGRQVHRFDPAAGRDHAWPMPAEVGCILPTEGTAMVVTLRETVGLLDPATGAVTDLARLPETVERRRTNDGAVDPAGNALVETLADDQRPGGGSLLRLRADGRLETLLDGLTIPNGIAWTADGSAMWFTDSPTGVVERIAYAPDGPLGTRRPAIAIQRGIPDGLAADVDGRVWVAQWGGWGVGCYEPDGRLVTWVDLPCANVTSCAFGGPALDELYVTTCRDGLTDADLAQQPLAGGLFVARPGASGQPTARFGSWAAR